MRDAIIQDVFHAARQLRRNPAFAIVVIAMLALGIGLNTAVFTVSNAILFSGFRLVDRNDRILYINNAKNGRYSGVSYSDLRDWQAQTKSFDGIGAVADARIILNDRSDLPERYIATRITANGFKLLGQRPILGRDFLPEDEQPGAEPVAIVAYRLWEQRYEKDPAIIGKTLQITGSAPVSVIGIMPEGFSFPQNQDLWLPLITTPELQRRDTRDLWFAFGRMADGVTRVQARAELETVASRLAGAYPETNKDQGIRAETFAQFFVNRNAAWVYGAIWGAVGFVLLIAGANLANLLLVRTIGRSREIAVRAALGAGRWRILRQLAIESLMLSAISATFGWIIARLGVRAYELTTNAPIGEWRRDLLNYAMDYRVMGYLVATSIGAGLLFGLIPAFRFSTRLDINAVLKDGGRGSTRGGHGRRLSRLLLVGEVTLAVVLLGGAGVMVHSFLNIYTANVGAQIEKIRYMLLHLPESRSANSEAFVSFYDRLKSRLEAIPGVESVSIGLPPASGMPPSRAYELAGSGSDALGRDTVAAIPIGPDYFRTLGSTVLSGREFNGSDAMSGIPAALVNRLFADQHWPGKTAIGKRFRLFNGDKPEAWLTVIGVVSNIVYDPTRQEITPVVYLPYSQRPRVGDMGVLIRTPIPVAGLAGTLRHEIRALDAGTPIWLGPYDLADRLSTPGTIYGNLRNNTALFLILGAIALLLASIGLYAVIAYSVSERTAEIGVRMAIGATSHDIFILILRQGIAPSAIGLIIGLGLSLAMNRVLTAELVNVSPLDPMTYFFVSVLLIASAILGCLIPARRAMRIDPVAALTRE